MSEAIHAGNARTKDEPAHFENSIGSLASSTEVVTGE
jgi:hypothetical protein